MDWLPWLTPFIMLLFGIAVKRFPFLAGIPNNLIWLCNLILGIAAKLAGPTDAEAGGFFSVAWKSLGWLWPPLQVMIARQLYETFVRPTEELAGVDPLHKPGKTK